MSAADLARALRGGGQLCFGPSSTALGQAYPGGGTALGLIKEFEIGWNFDYFDVIAEEWGEVLESDQILEQPILAFTLEQWDDDIFKKVFSKVTTANSPSGLKDMARLDGGSGPRVVVVTPPILFWPNDRRNKAVLFRRPIPKVPQSARTAMSMTEDTTCPLIFIAGRDDSGKPPYEIDRLEHLLL